MSDRLYWAWCALCFHVGMRMPEPIWFRLLPWIGTYAHCEDFNHFRELRDLRRASTGQTEAMVSPSPTGGGSIALHVPSPLKLGGES